MSIGNLSSTQHASLLRNQEKYSAYWIARGNASLSDAYMRMENLICDPTLQPVFAIDYSLINLVSELNVESGLYKEYARKILLDHMGYYCNCAPLIAGEIPGKDVRPRIADEIVFLIWHSKMYSRGYRLLTTQAAAELHERNTSIFLRSWLESYYSWEYHRSRKIRHAVRLAFPLQHNIDGNLHTSYSLETAHSNAEYNFSVLAATEKDSTMQGSWFYKPSSWKTPR